jgi:exopolyphosphatase / guanosine-5'-triphosphate,3'-diphosphate pyrophosphatase
MNLMTDPAREEFLALMQTLEVDQPHVQHVAQLAVHLFDELEDLHGMGDSDRLLLEAAACLHDIGHSVESAGKGHHRESARLIREHGWQHFSAERVNLIALVARYHRKSLPDLEHEDYAALAPLERLKVQKLAAFLRIADGMDRSHRQLVTHFSAEIFPERILIHLSAANSVEKEIDSATKKADLAEAVFQRVIRFNIHPLLQN